MGLGAMQALKDADMNDVVVVGFDATPDAATSILKGEMTATIAQFSYNMGAYGVKYALELANGCLLYTSPSPRDRTRSRMPSSA